MERCGGEWQKLSVMSFQAKPDAPAEAALTSDLFSLDAMSISTKLATYELRAAVSRQL